MSNARLTALSVERFKSFKESTRIDLYPLTIVLGRNNSGKSSLIQSLLLLKQTLADPRPDVMLRLEGIVEAFSLSELTFGWPKDNANGIGPSIMLEWECEVDIQAAILAALKPDQQNLANNSGVEWLSDPPNAKMLKTSMTLRLKEVNGITAISEIELIAIGDDCREDAKLVLRSDPWECYWGGKLAKKIDVELDHFIPYLRIDRSQVGPRDKQRAWHNAYLILFAQPLESLKKLLAELHYLGAGRLPPPSLYKPATTPPNEVGINGELAAQLLHRRQKEIAHFLPPLSVENGSVEIPKYVMAQPLVNAVNSVLNSLSINTALKVDDSYQVGFRIMFGDSSIAHVGRGLGYILPLIELGLIADPLRFTGNVGETSIEEYVRQCSSYSHILLEEPEAHLHPKVASRLAHWLVSLALTNRQLVVETHSDHLVRRLRGLVARAGRNSKLEQWLLNNVAIISVEQDDCGKSSIKKSMLTAEGGVAEVWPADFMDEATDEESAIYYAKLDKESDDGSTFSKIGVINEEEPEVDSEP